MASLSSPPITGLSLLFVKVADVAPPNNNNQYTDVNGLELIYSIEKVSGRGSIECAQRIKNVFRVYCKTQTAYIKLSTEGFTHEGHQVCLYTRNPFSVQDQAPDTVKIIIGGVPLSVATDEFSKALLDLNVEMLSEFKFENYRDKEGKWTNYKTGRRFVYCKKPALNLKPFTRIGLWNASVYYRGQVRPKRYVTLTGDSGEPTSAQDQACDLPSTVVNTSDAPADTVSETASSSKTVDAIGNAPPTVPSGITNDSGKSDASPSKADNRTNDNKNKTGKSPQSRGRSLKKHKVDNSQKQISSIFQRRVSPSNSRSRTKRQFKNDSPSFSPPTPKSNSRSNSYHTDWFDVTVEGDL